MNEGYFLIFLLVLVWVATRGISKKPKVSATDYKEAIAELDGIIDNLRYTICQRDRDTEKLFYDRDILSKENKSLECHLAIAKQELASLRIEISKKQGDKELTCNIDISDPIFQKMIKAGRSVLVKRAHPDHGGNLKAFEKVEKAFEILKDLKVETKKNNMTQEDLFERNRQAFWAQQQRPSSAEQQRAAARGSGLYNF